MILGFQNLTKKLKKRKLLYRPFFLLLKTEAMENITLLRLNKTYFYDSKVYEYYFSNVNIFRTLDLINESILAQKSNTKVHCLSSLMTVFVRI